VVVVENGSSDGTPDYLRSLADPRVKALVFDRPLGATSARNAGLAAASGTWVGLLDDDDLWAPTKLKSQLTALEATGRDWAYTGCVYVDETCRLIGGVPPGSPDEVAKELPQRYSIPGGMSSMIWRAGSLDQGGLLEPRLTYSVDWDLSLRLLRMGSAAVVPEPMVANRQHGSNMSVSARTYLPELRIIEEKFADLRKGVPINLAYQYRNAGSESLRANERRAALRYYARAARMGDWGAVLRSVGVFLPRRSWPVLRRLLLSDRAWMTEADQWVRSYRGWA